MPNMDCPPNDCRPVCDQVFEALQVSYLIRGGTRVMWELQRDLSLPLPWSFQLQYSPHPRGSVNWVNVGLAVENTFYAIDADRRDYGQAIRGFYRVVLTAGGTSYTSAAFSVDGTLSARDWRLAQEILRKERLRAHYTAQQGYLLRLRSSGSDCSRCLDIQTREPMDPNCPNCLGTGKECGYYYPMDCVWADLAPLSRDLKIDDQLVRGTVEDVATAARMIVMPPFLSAFDVWVSQRTDQRYTIHSIKHVAEMRGVPLIANVEMRLLPYTHPAYNIAIPQQDAWVSS